MTKKGSIIPIGFASFPLRRDRLYLLAMTAEALPAVYLREAGRQAGISCRWHNPSKKDSLYSKDCFGVKRPFTFSILYRLAMTDVPFTISLASCYPACIGQGREV